MSQLRIAKEPQKGSIIVAEPMLGDPNFDRTVILLTEHNEHGSVGFVINKPLDLELDEVVIDFPSFQSRIFHGGPVQEDNLYFVHNKGDLIPGSQHIRDELYWGGDLAPLKEMIEMGLITDQNIRFFLGYSGWGEGQLMHELKEGSWVVLADSVVDLFAENDIQTWRQVLVDLGGDYPLWANTPADPNLN